MEHADLTVSVVYSAAVGQLDWVDVRLSAGATVRMALTRSGMLERHPDIDLSRNKVGVWGKLRGLDEALRDADRVEVYRPLLVDPKEARRQRYRGHREKLAAGKR